MKKHHEQVDGAELVRVLKEGYWERTAIVRTHDGELRVRKESRGEGTEMRPWARLSLVREINYMRTLTGDVRELFPRICASWGEDQRDGVLGYEMEFLDGWSDLGSLVQAGEIDPARGRELEWQIATAVLSRIHQKKVPEERLSTHVRLVMDLACDELESREGFAPVFGADEIRIDSRCVPGLRRAIELVSQQDLFGRLDTGPQVRLHGDLILENILVPATPEARRADRPILLIDPVSVAGVTGGHPMFDLVKYESYTRGSLFAIRSGAMVGQVVDVERRRYQLFDESGAEATTLFRIAGFEDEFRAAYEAKYGEVDFALERLLDAYFSLAMALNTTGAQPLTRALVAALALGSIVT